MTNSQFGSKNVKNIETEWGNYKLIEGPAHLV